MRKSLTLLMLMLLGCTDLNAVDARVPKGMTLLDATECLARAVVRRYVERAAG